MKTLLFLIGYLIFCPAFAKTKNANEVNFAPAIVSHVITNHSTICGLYGNGRITFTTSGIPNGEYFISYHHNGISRSGYFYLMDNSVTINNLLNGTYIDFYLHHDSPNYVQYNTPITITTQNKNLTTGLAQNPSACGANDGSISFTTTGFSDGNYTLNYLKTNPYQEISTSVTIEGNAFVLEGLSAGTHINFLLAATEDCQIYDRGLRILTQPVSSLVIGSSQNPSACGASDGSISFTTTGISDGTYTFNYQNLSTNQNISTSVTVTGGVFVLNNLLRGVYLNFSLTAPGCTINATGSRTLSQPSTSLFAGAVQHITICGASDGSLSFTTLNIANGTYPFTYQRNGQNVTANVTITNGAFVLGNLSSGNYNNFGLLVDVNGANCNAFSSNSRTINEPSLFSVVSSQHSTVCGADGDGSIEFATEISDGTYTLNFSPYGPANVIVNGGIFTLENLRGSYYSDFSLVTPSCTTRTLSSVYISAPAPPTLAISGNTRPSTCTSTDGAIHFNIDLPNGTYSFNYERNYDPYTVSVVVNAGAFSLTDLQEGSYGYFSINNNECISSLGEYVSVNLKAYTLSIVGRTHPSFTSGAGTCGNGDGSVTLSTNFPDGSYTLTLQNSWTPTYVPITVTGGRFTVSSLYKGVHQFSISHGGCSTPTVSITLQPTVPMPLVSVNPPTTCGLGSVTFETPMHGSIYHISYYPTNPLNSNDYYAYINTPVTGGQVTVPVLSDRPVTNFVYRNDTWISGQPCELYYRYDDTLTLTPAEQLVLTAQSIVQPTCSTPTGSITFHTNKTPGSDLRIVFQRQGVSISEGFGLEFITIAADSTFTISGLVPGTYTDFQFVEYPGPQGNLIRCNPLPISVVIDALPALTFTSKLNPITCSSNNGSISLSLDVPNGNYTINYKKNGVDGSLAVTVNSGVFSMLNLGHGTYTDFSISYSGCNYTLTTPIILECPCPSVLNLVSTPDDVSTGNHLKQASSVNGKITATNKITGSAKVNYQASSITLSPGFVAQNGTTFTAQTGGCN